MAMDRPSLTRATTFVTTSLEKKKFKNTSVTSKKGPLRLIVLYTCINLRGMIFMGFPSYYGTKTAAGTTIGNISWDKYDSFPSPSGTYSCPIFCGISQ